MRRRAALVAFALAACRVPAATVAAPGAHRAQADAFPRPRVDEPVWTVVGTAGIPTPIRDVAALGDDAAVVLAGGALWRWRAPDRLDVVCQGALARGEEPFGVRAQGRRFLAMGGDEAAPFAVRSDDGGDRCERVRLPTLFVRDTPRGALGFTLHEAAAYAWSGSGAVVASADGGRSWRRLPTLPDVLEVAPGGGGATLAAAAIGRWGDRRRARLMRLASPDSQWAPVARAEHLRAPVVIQAQADGGTLVADDVGVLALDAQGAFAWRRVDPAARAPERAFVGIVPAGSGRFLASSRALLHEVDARRTAAFGALPRLRGIRAIDASPGGAVWATDGRGLWRGRFDAPLVEVSSGPLPAEDPAALAVRGSEVLLAGAEGTLAWSRDGGARWRRQSLPPEIGRVQAAHLDDLGTGYVLGDAGVAVRDGAEVAWVPAPHAPPIPGAAASFATLGDRWVIVGGDLRTSDERGARWEARMGPDPARTDRERSDAALVAHALSPSGAAMLFDLGRRLWRTDDAATTFEHVSSLGDVRNGGVEAHALVTLAWDGARNVAVLARGFMWRSADGGATFEPPANLPFVAHWAGFAGDTLVAAGASSNVVPLQCRTGQGASLHVLRADGWVADPEACAHRGLNALFARDGDALWTVDENAVLHRASLSRLVRAVAR